VEPNQIARLAAAELTSAMDSTILEQTELAIRGELPVIKTSRDWSTVSETVKAANEIVNIAHFLIFITPIFAAKFREFRNLDLAKRAVALVANDRTEVSPEGRKQVIDAVSRVIETHPD